MIHNPKLKRALSKSDVYLRYPLNVARRVIDIGMGTIFGRALSKYREGNVVSFHIGRCGSTVLGDLLNQHPNIFWDGEILTRYYWYKRRKYTSLAPDAMQKLQRKIILSRMNIAGRKYYGFETRLSQPHLFNLTLKEYIEQLDELGFNHFILLERRNYLRAAVSWIIATHKFKYHQPLSRKAALHSIRLDIHNVCMDEVCKPLISYFEEWDQYYRKAERLLKERKTLKIIYEEDILTNPYRGYERVCAFLGLKPESAIIQHGRTNPFHLKKILLNYNEVATVLKGTRFEWMLSEE